MSRTAEAARAIDDYKAAYRLAWKRDPPEDIGYANGWVLFERSGFRPLRIRLDRLIRNTERLRLL